MPRLGCDPLGCRVSLMFDLSPTIFSGSLGLLGACGAFWLAYFEDGAEGFGSLGRGILSKSVGGIMDLGGGALLDGGPLFEPDFDAPLDLGSSLLVTFFL